MSRKNRRKQKQSANTAATTPEFATFPAPRDGYRANGVTHKKGAPVLTRYGRVLPPGEVSHDPANGIPDAPQNFGRNVIPQIITFGSRWSGVSNVYRNPDQAVRESLENARFMRNDPSIMECLEARQRAVALLPWSIEAEEKDDPDQKELADQLTDIVGRTAQFTEYRRNLLEATWCGRYAIQHQFGWEVIKGKRRSVVQQWQPINGDKLVFRYDDGSGQYLNGQVGIRAYAGGNNKDALAGARKLEPTGDQSMAYFLEPWERGMIALHRHIIEDGAFEDPLSAGRIHGVGIRDRIYWCWFQKQEAMATLMEIIQRTGTGFTIYYYEQGNPKSEAAMKALAENQTFSNILLMPRTPGDQGDGNGIERIEPNSAGISVLQEIIHNFFEWQIKRYIMGQTLTSEASGTGMGSGVAQAHQDTFYQIVKYDAVKLEETLTTDLVEPLRNYNLPHARDFKFFFRIKVDDPASDRILQSAKTAWDMGAKLPAKAILDICGIAAPKPDEEVLCNQQPVTPGGDPNGAPPIDSDDSNEPTSSADLFGDAANEDEPGDDANPNEEERPEGDEGNANEPIKYAKNDEIWTADQRIIEQLTRVSKLRTNGENLGTVRDFFPRTSEWGARVRQLPVLFDPSVAETIRADVNGIRFGLHSLQMLDKSRRLANQMYVAAIDLNDQFEGHA